MTVMVAMDGLAALRIVDQITPDLILLDAIMPGMDGFETCRRLKRDAGLVDVPVIFMTGLSETEHIVRGLEAGGVDYVTKPIVIEEMLARIRVHLANARLTQSARNALDVSGRFLLAVDKQGKMLWATPQAQKLLAELFSLRPTTRSCCRRNAKLAGQMQKAGAAADTPAVFPNWYDQTCNCNSSVRPCPDEILLRLVKGSSQRDAADLGKRLGLTSRESEVLSWLSKGKTNRDIAQILGLSPRTIDKHLEQIYAKLGVENRTAAAAMAVSRGDQST